MKLIFKILKTIFITALALVAILLSLSLLFEKQITRLFIDEINKNIITRADVEQVSFSLLKNFPQASIELKNITIASPFTLPGEQNNPDKDLLRAEHLHVSLKLTHLIKKNYTVDRIYLKKGYVNILTGSDGKSNLNIWEKNSGSEGGGVSLDLKNIRIDKTFFSYINATTGFRISGEIDNASSKLSLSGNETSLSLSSIIRLDSLFNRGKKILPDNFRSSVKGDMIISPGLFSFKNVTLTTSGQVINLDGVVKKSSGALDINAACADLDFAEISRLLPGRLAAKIGRYNISGKGPVRVNLTGKFSDGNSIVLTGSSEIARGSVSIPGKEEMVFKNIYASTGFKASLADLSETLIIDAETLSFTLYGSGLYGSAKVSNLISPYVDIVLNGDVLPGEILKREKIKGITGADGVIHASIRVWGELGNRDNTILQKILSLDRSLNLSFRSVNLMLKNLKYPIEDICGNIMLAENMWVDELSFSLADQSTILNGMADGISNRINGKNSKLSLTAGVWTNRLDPVLLRDIINRSSPPEEKKSPSFTENLEFHLDINCDSLILGNFRSSLFSGNISYKDGFFNISSFEMMSLKGYLAGNAAFIRNSSDNYFARGWFDIEQIDINETFRVFNNFGQDKIVSGNLKGNLTGTLSVSASLLNSFKPDVNTLEVTGNYTIEDGELIDFEPVTKLSRFVELSELKEIKFKELSNDLIIKNKKIMIPNMDVHSSAFNISASGEHNFNGNYEYHLEILLSDLLSKKVAGRSANSSEFGVVEDDGLGRNTIYLKIENGETGSKVSYDMQTFREELKEDLQQEKQNLKSIFNREYGWYGSDSIPESKSDETRKFRITWEETDSIITVPVKKKEKSLPLLKIFKKKRLNESTNQQY